MNQLVQPMLLGPISLSFANIVKIMQLLSLNKEFDLGIAFLSSEWLLFIRTGSVHPLGVEYDMGNTVICLVKEVIVRYVGAIWWGMEGLRFVPPLFDPGLMIFLVGPYLHAA